MKILIVTDTFYPHVNGSSYFCQRLSVLLKANGHDVRVLCPGISRHGEETLFHGVPVSGLPSISLLSYGYRFAPPFFIKERVEAMIRSFCPDVIHCNSHFSPNTVVLPIAKKLGIPILASNHFTPENLMPYLHLPLSLTPLLRTMFWRSWTKTYRHFDTIVSPTKAAADILRLHTPVRRLTVISNGVDTVRFHPISDRAGFRRRFGVTDDRPVIACVGRLDREKHVDVLLRAFALFRQNKPSKLLIAGKGADQERLCAIARSLKLDDDVTFLGFVADDDLPHLYAASDCYAIASIAELQSISTLEAMASGLPVVAARAMALPELVIHDRNGYTFAPDDSDDCARCFEKVFASDTHRYALSAQSLAMAQHHDIQKSIAAFERLYTSLVNGRNEFLCKP